MTVMHDHVLRATVWNVGNDVLTESSRAHLQHRVSTRYWYRTTDWMASHLLLCCICSL